MRQPRQERAQVTLEAILQAAHELYLIHGAGITAQQITVRAGVAVGTLYRYFPNKERILPAVADYRLSLGTAALVSGFNDDAGCARTGIERLVDGLLAVYQAEVRLLRLLDDQGLIPPSIVSAGGEHVKALARVLGTALPVSVVSPQVVSSLLITVEAADTLCRRFVLDPHPHTTAEEFRRELVLLLDGYLSRLTQPARFRRATAA